MNLRRHPKTILLGSALFARELDKTMAEADAIQPDTMSRAASVWVRLFLKLNILSNVYAKEKK